MDAQDPINGVNFDISHLLEDWDYAPGQVVVRKLRGRDGLDKIQLRVDLGLLQMNAEGRPDGKRPFGHETAFDFYQARLCNFLGRRSREAGAKFKLKAEDCTQLQLEALQYHHRYICLLQLGDYAGVMRDTERNLEVFDFVEKYAETEEMAWSLQQFQPQLLMILTRARATEAMEEGDYPTAIDEVESGMERIREFFREHSKHDLMEQSGELLSLENWLTEIRTNRPLSPRERLERALSEAVQREDYEKAAKMRDALRNLRSSSQA